MPIPSSPLASSPEALELEPPSASRLKGKVRQGSFWVLGGYGVSQALRLGSNLILWRILFPEAFGIMSLVNVFMQGLQMFSDVGIGPSIVQNKRGTDPTYLNTAWTIQVARGVILFVCALVVSRPVAAFYGEPELALLIPAVAVGSILAGLNSTRMFSATRELALKRLTLLDLATQIFGLSVTIGLSYLWRSVWGLVVGGLAASALRMLLSHTVLPGNRDRLKWDKPSVQELVRFGRWIFVSTLLTFATINADRLIFGKLIPLDLLGVYSIGMMWATFPMTAIDHVFHSVMFPLLSRYNDSPGGFAPAYRRARTPWLLVGGLACSCLLAGGPVLIRCLYDDRATAAGWIIQFLAGATWLLCLESATSTALLARGQSQWVAAGSAGKLVGMLICIPVGFKLAGFPGALTGYAGSELLRYAVCVVGAIKHRLGVMIQDLSLSGLVVLTAALGWLTSQLVGPTLDEWPLGSHRIAAALDGMVIVLVLGSIWGGLFLMLRWRGAKRPS